jgi:type III pantothenate kinase
MKFLSVDVGNTTVHLCEFEGGRAREVGRFRHEELPEFIGEYERIGAVCVRKDFEPVLKNLFGKKLKIIRKEDIPLRVDYKTPETLGTDRVLNAYAVLKKGHESAVVVSAGTALVVDLLLEGIFMGGFITAGPKTKASCLSFRAQGVPPVEPAGFTDPVGKSTEECVRGGLFLESYFFIKATAERWMKTFKKELPIIITGGDGHLFEELGEYDPLLIHRGVYSIIING